MEEMGTLSLNRAMAFIDGYSDPESFYVGQGIANAPD